MDYQLRKNVLFQNLNYFASNKDYLKQQADNNLNRKKTMCTPAEIYVLQGDWGDVLLKLSFKYGSEFVVLNMANTYVPGGGYLQGCPAQEENMFRRSDCHFNIINDPNVSWDDTNNHYIYNKKYQDLINAKNGLVYLDNKNPRILFADNETNKYKILPNDKIIPFYEMRSAAIDCSQQPFDIKEMEKRIVAQFNTAKKVGLEYLLLGAFGCGAFQCPPKIVAEIYKKTIKTFINDFSVIAFAIYYPGYGPTDNYDIFKSIIESESKF